MSYLGSKSDAVAAIASVELSENTRTSSGTSPILHGASGPGGAAAKAKPAGEVQVVGRLRAGIKTPLTATDSLKRKG
jgi:hypothetical protein